MTTDKLALQLEQRSIIGKKVKNLRREGIIPATVYGKGVEPVSVQVDEKTFGLLYRQAGRSALVELQIPGMKTQSAFIQAIQRHPVTRRILHADLRVVNLNEPITVDVPVRLVGENTMVEKGQATFNQQHATLSVTALPANVPQHIDIDISELDLESEVRVRDLAVPAEVTVLTDAEDLVLSLTETRSSIESASDEEAEIAGAEPELIREEREGDDEA
jgi:large subunit ribosomal protein L25